MHTNAKIKNLYFWLFIYIYAQILIRYSFSFFLFSVFCWPPKSTWPIIKWPPLLCSWHVMLVLPPLLLSSPLSLSLLLMARCYCLLDFNILAANKYAIRRNLNSMQRDQQTLTSQQAEQHKLLAPNTNTNKFKYESRHTQIGRENWGGRDAACIRMPKVWTIKIYEAIKVRARLAVFYGQRSSEVRTASSCRVDIAHFVLQLTSIFPHSATTNWQGQAHVGGCLKVSARITHRWLIDWLNSILQRSVELIIWWRACFHLPPARLPPWLAGSLFRLLGHATH